METSGGKGIQVKREATDIAPRSVPVSFSVGGSMKRDMPGAVRQDVRLRVGL